MALVYFILFNPFMTHRDYVDDSVQTLHSCLYVYTRLGRWCRAWCEPDVPRRALKKYGASTISASFRYYLLSDAHAASAPRFCAYMLEDFVLHTEAATTFIEDNLPAVLLRRAWKSSTEEHYLNRIGYKPGLALLSWYDVPWAI